MADVQVILDTVNNRQFGQTMEVPSSVGIAADWITPGPAYVRADFVAQKNPAGRGLDSRVYWCITLPDTNVLAAFGSAEDHDAGRAFERLLLGPNVYYFAVTNNDEILALKAA